MPNRAYRRKRSAQMRKYSDLPLSTNVLGLLLPDFADWLRAYDGQPIPCKGKYEIARYIRATCEGEHIIYRTAHGDVTWTPDTAEDFRLFLSRETPLWAREQVL